MGTLFLFKEEDLDKNYPATDLRWEFCSLFPPLAPKLLLIDTVDSDRIIPLVVGPLLVSLIIKREQDDYKERKGSSSIREDLDFKV